MPVRGYVGAQLAEALWGVYTAVAGAHRHDVNQHHGAMLGLYAGILIAGTLTFLPGRMMHRMFFE